jgi:hypothetical protein
MRLTLLRDSDVGNPLGEVNISDHPDEGELGDALDGLAEQAQWTLVEEPAEKAKAAEAAEKAAAKEQAAAEKTTASK